MKKTILDENFRIYNYSGNFIIIDVRGIYHVHMLFYKRWAAYSSNTKIAKAISQKLGKDFDFSEYDNFDFDKSILEEKD